MVTRGRRSGRGARPGPVRQVALVPVAPELVTLAFVKPVPNAVAPALLAPAVLAPDVLAPAMLAPDVLAPAMLAPAMLAPDVLAPAGAFATGRDGRGTETLAGTDLGTALSGA
jgi:hypothetical protein